MKKRLVALLTAGVMAGSLMMAGCGSSAAPAAEEPAAEEAVEEAAEETEEEAEEPAAEEEAEAPADESGKTYRIGFSNASVSNSWRVKMRDMLIEAVEERGDVILEETDANDNASQQIADIESLLQRDLDAILITPAVEDAVAPAIEEAYASGIPVILFDRTANTEDYTHFVGWTDVNNGAACAQLIVDALTEKYGEPRGNVVALDSIAGSGTDNGQKEGQESVFSQYPDIKIIDRQYTDFEASEGKAAMEDFLAKHPSGEIDAVISQDGIVTLAAYQAIEEQGRVDDNIIIVNADGVNGVCRMIKEGTAYGLTQFPCAASVAALDLAIQTLEGNDPEEKIVVMDPVVVTAENVDEYYIPDGDDEDWTY